MLSALEIALEPASLAIFLGESIDPYIRSRAEARFASEGDDVVGKWLPLASSTEQIRAQAGYGPAHPINRRTGELEEYITKSPHRIETTPIGASLVMPGEPAGGELGKKVITAQEGWPASGRSGATPPRPVIGVNEKDLLFVLTSLSTYVEKAMLI
jgi:hypothetical protein